MAAGLWNAGLRIDNSVSVENGLDARLSENRGRCDADKKREPGNSGDHRNSNRNNKGRFHSLTPQWPAITPPVMMTVASRKCKPETRRLARLVPSG
jgi:hypothetical protein